MPRDTEKRGNWRLVGAGTEFAGAVLVLALIGYGIDHWLGTEPWGVIVGTLLGFAGGMYNLIKLAQLAQQEQDDQDTGDPDA